MWRERVWHLSPRACTNALRLCVMPVVLYVVLFSIAGSILSLAGGVLLLVRRALPARVLDILVAFAAGTLLGAACIDLLPDAVERGGGISLVAWIALGFAIFYVVERIVHGSTPLIIASDTLHNFLDGIVIGGTFVAGVPVGIATSLAVAAHEIPQEIGDFAMLLRNGMSRSRVLLVNVLSAIVTVIGALATWRLGPFLMPALPAFLAIASGMFFYIAAVDLIPHLRRHWTTVLSLLGGVGAIAALA